jgi:Domain of unknown function (DUF1707)/Cell wall-active antibiotics response 4TMS YvqF
VGNLPEPTDQRRSLRVSDTDRERVAEVLRDAAGQGRITMDELDERLGAAYAAKTYADLEIVTRDLPTPHPVTPPVWSAGGFSPDRIGGSPGVRFSVAIMSAARRAGPWVVPPTYVSFALMGGVQLDLRHARFSGPEATIHAYALMGGIEIIVPEDIGVDVAGIGFMGGFDHSASGPGIPGAPRLKVIGFALMGGVDVKRKPAQEPGKGEPGRLAKDDQQPRAES